ncbi:MAG: hypothetical protein ACRDVG_04795 [Jatrophihabitantaceae bacterium]
MKRLLALLITAAAFTTGAITATAATPLPHTQRVVVRPVHANGTPVAGYTVTHESIPGFTCDSVSTVAVDPNIRFCGYSATYTVACWKSANHTVLCLRDPRAKSLVRIRYTGRFAPVARPHRPSPQALGLFNGGYCMIRDGGAWGWVQGHPQWAGAYSCRHVDVYGTGRDGIDRSVNPWRVHTVAFTQSGQSIVNRRVRTAYYVGTA